MLIRILLILLLLGSGLAAAQTKPRAAKPQAAEPAGVRLPEKDEAVPPIEPMQTEIVLPPSACRIRLSKELAEAPSVLPRADPNGCGGEDLVRLESITLPEQGKVAVSPPAVLRCTMAAALVDWVRDEVAPIVQELGTRMTAFEGFSAYQCRGRNNVAGAKLSEHGKANAFDLRGLKLANGKQIDLTDASADRALRDRLREGACARFTTVLGPGADPYHENHIHLDLAERRNGYRICQWDVRDPRVAAVPLPLPRPNGTGGADDAGAAGMSLRQTPGQPRPQQEKVTAATPPPTDAAGNTVGRAVRDAPAAADRGGRVVEAVDRAARAVMEPGRASAGSRRDAARSPSPRVFDPAGNSPKRTGDRRAGR